MKKIETLGNYNLVALNGWLPVESFCQNMPYSPEEVRNLRHCGQWLDGVITKCLRKRIEVNVWEVRLWRERNGLN